MIGTETDAANADIERLLRVKATTFAYTCGQKFIGEGTKTESYLPLAAKRFLIARGFRDEAANDPVYCDFAQIFGIDSDGMTFADMRDAIVSGANEGGWVAFAGQEIGSEGRQTTRTDSIEQLQKYAKDAANSVCSIGRIELRITSARTEAGNNNDL